ncbi:uncharacterized protein EI90DRAFT_3068594, partial [Cantharellus anzutake]|uniref:uncharacterized protein n=1 Tax=Cantharellus anzutake TaxID=1750568 RepID=UPI0019030E7C
MQEPDRSDPGFYNSRCRVRFQRKPIDHLCSCFRRNFPVSIFCEILCRRSPLPKSANDSV